jgi:hypothetical protein
MLTTFDFVLRARKHVNTHTHTHDGSKVIFFSLNTAYTAKHTEVDQVDRSFWSNNIPSAVL